jgi:hypothetical protein
MSSEDVVWHPSGWSPVFHAAIPSTDKLIGFTRLRVFEEAERVTVTRPGLVCWGWCIVDLNRTSKVSEIWLL